MLYKFCCSNSTEEQGRRIDLNWNPAYVLANDSSNTGGTRATL